MLSSYVIFGHTFTKENNTDLLSMLRKCLALIHGILRKVPIFRLTYWILYNDKMPQRINQWKMKKKMWAVGKILSLNWTWKSKKRTFLPSCLLGQREGERQREEQTTKRLVEILLVSLTGIYFHIILAGKCTLSGWLVAWSNTPFIRLRCINGCMLYNMQKVEHCTHKSEYNPVDSRYMDDIAVSRGHTATQLHIEKPYWNIVKEANDNEKDGERQLDQKYRHVKLEQTTILQQATFGITSEVNAK